MLDRFDVAEHFDTVPELADRAFNRPRKATLETAQVIFGARKKLENVCNGTALWRVGAGTEGETEATCACRFEQGAPVQSCAFTA